MAVALPRRFSPSSANEASQWEKITGSGLGLYHARMAVESWGGKLLIRSQQGKGTSVGISIPETVAPSWFVPFLQVPARGTRVVVLDDDPSIHNLWEERLKDKTSGAEERQMIHFYEAREFCLLV